MTQEEVYTESRASMALPILQLGIPRNTPHVRRYANQTQETTRHRRTRHSGKQPYIELGPAYSRISTATQATVHGQARAIRQCAFQVPAKGMGRIPSKQILRRLKSTKLGCLNVETSTTHSAIP